MKLTSLADVFGVAGDARSREEVVFDFLTNQAKKPDADAWRLASEKGGATNLGFLALLVSNLIDGRHDRESGSGEKLYAIAEELLGESLTLEAYEQWLRAGVVSVVRLAGHLDHAFAR